MKKVVSFLLSALLIFTLTTVAFPAFAGDEADVYPIVYISGQGSDLYRKVEGTSEKERIYPSDYDALDGVMEQLEPLLKKAALGFVEGDYEDYTNTLNSVMSPMYAEYILGKDGMPTDGSFPAFESWMETKKISCLRGSFIGKEQRYPAYFLTYDWRLSPIVIAQQLNEVVDAVLEQTGAEKVNIISRCLGTNVVYAYLANKEYRAEEKVASCIFYASALKGMNSLDALFTGEFTVDDDALDSFIEYYQDDRNIIVNDEATTEMLLSLIQLLKEVKVLSTAIDSVVFFASDIARAAVPVILKSSYATFPSYWSMVNADCYEKAKDFIFSTPEEKEEWAGLIEQTDAYYEIQKDMDETLKALSDKINFYVISKYGSPCAPLYKDSGEEGDRDVTVSRSSLGATAADYNKKLSPEYIENAKENGTFKYISADGKIDASTAIFPDTTWFVKNLKHSEFPDCINDMMIDIFKSHGTMTVWTSPEYTQYLEYHFVEEMLYSDEKGTVTPILTAKDTNDVTADFAQGSFDALLRFFMRFIEFVLELILKIPNLLLK